MADQVTFLRVRPAATCNELWAATRRREGTTAAELAEADPGSRTGALAGGLLPVAVGAEPEAAASIIDPGADPGGLPGFRLTVNHTEDRALTLDTLARTGAAFLRTGRSRVAEASDLAALPGVSATVSVFVDTVEGAVSAVDGGAGDLLLRDWDTERLGRLRDALAPRRLVERTALAPQAGIEEVRASLPGEVFRVWLEQTDASGAARPRSTWAPGKRAEAPVPPGRLSAAWNDTGWAGRPPGSGSAEIAAILERALDGTPPGRDEVERLFRARGDDVDVIATAADELRRRRCGDVVTYVVNRNINYTNQCYFRCGFCAFSKGPRSLNLRGDPYLMNPAEIAARAGEAWERGATEVCLQGGIHPGFTGAFYVEVLAAIRDAVPEMHCHGFTPLEVWQGAATLGIEVREFLIRLRDAGLGTLPGTAAEILDDRIRAHLCPDKIRTAQWAEVMLTAHDLGIRSTATMMFGHIDDPAAWANHIEVLREIQRRSGGFTEFVPLPFVHMGAPIYLQGRSRPGPTWDEVVLVHAVARVALAGLIDNIQVSWVKLGMDAAIRLLAAGCNDLGGTLMDETISRSAGAAHGQAVGPARFAAAIRRAGRTPQQRSTLYAPVAAAAGRLDA